MSATPHIFLGYDEYSRDGYVVFDPRTQHFYTRRTVVFDETWRQRHMRMGHLPSYADNPLLPDLQAPHVALHDLLVPVQQLPAPRAAPEPAPVHQPNVPHPDAVLAPGRIRIVARIQGDDIGCNGTSDGTSDNNNTGTASVSATFVGTSDGYSDLVGESEATSTSDNC